MSSLLKVTSALSPETPISHCSPGRQPLPHLLLSSPTWTSRFWSTPGTCNLGLCSLSSLSLTSAAFPKHIHVIPLVVPCSARAASTNFHFASLKGTFVNMCHTTGCSFSSSTFNCTLLEVPFEPHLCRDPAPFLAHLPTAFLTRLLLIYWVIYFPYVFQVVFSPYITPGQVCHVSLDALLSEMGVVQHGLQCMKSEQAACSRRAAWLIILKCYHQLSWRS